MGKNVVAFILGVQLGERLTVGQSDIWQLDTEGVMNQQLASRQRRLALKRVHHIKYIYMFMLWRSQSPGTQEVSQDSNIILHIDSGVRQRVSHPDTV